MCPVPLSHEQWADIHSELPDVAALCSRINSFPYADWIDFAKSELEDGTVLLRSPETLSRLRKSRGSIQDAANALLNARYALSQAMGVRQYYLSLSSDPRDENHVLADLRSRFYGDYVPLLLCSCVEHTLTVTIQLHALSNKPKKVKDRERRIDAVRREMMEKYPKSNLTSVLAQLADSETYKAVSKYRNDWVHNEPHKVESILYQPRRRDYIQREGNMIMSAMGVSHKPDYSWDAFIALLKAALTEVSTFVEMSADEWIRTYEE